MFFDDSLDHRRGGPARGDYGRVEEFLRILSAEGWNEPSLDILCRTFGRFFNSSWSVLYSVEPVTQKARRLTSQNVPEDIQIPSPWSDMMVDEVVRTGLGICLNGGEERYGEGTDPAPGHSVLSIPLFVRGLILGVLILGRSVREPFSENDVDESLSVSPFAALFMSNLLAVNTIKEKKLELEEEQEELKKINTELARSVKKLKSDSGKLEKAFQELSEAAKAKNEFFENLSHELRTPLTPILASSEALIGSTFGRMSPEQEEIVEVLYLSAKRLELLIEDLLEMVKLESGSLKLERECLDIRAIIEESNLETLPLAKDKDIKIEIDLDPEIPFVLGDKKRLSQLFVNLLHNAVKFSHEGGRVTVRQNRSKEAKGLMGIAVIDEGIGIPSDVIDRIFDRFYQANSERSGSGLGLGLAIVKRIVEAHEGELEVESQENRGTTFTVFLPLHRE